MTLWWLAYALGFTTLAWLYLAVMFRPLEVYHPARRGQPLFRPGWLTDLGFFFGQYLVWSALVLDLLAAFRDSLGAVVPAGLRQGVAAQPWCLQAVEIVLMSDLIVYWGHRLQHRVDFLWRFHSVHHSAEHLDWLAAHREHPLDTVWTVGLVNLPAYVLGFPLETLAHLITFRGLWAIYIHSNVRLPLGRLRVLIGAPELHHWHHARERDAGNYANVSPLMDVLFGTYRCPDHEPEAFGLAGQAPRGYLSHLVRPLLPALLFGALCAPAGGAAPQPPDAREALERFAWPAGIAFELADPAVVPAQDALQLEVSLSAGPSHEETVDLAPRFSPTKPRPRPGGAGPLTAPVDPVVAAVERHRSAALAFELTRIDVTQAGRDVAKLAAVQAHPSHLRPLLLFLAERGVIKRSEVDAMLAEPDLDALMRAIEERSRKLVDHRDREQVLAYLAEMRPRSGGPR